MPHEILDTDLRGYQFDLLVAEKGSEEEVKNHKEAMKGMKRRGK